MRRALGVGVVVLSLFSMAGAKAATPAAPRQLPDVVFQSVAQARTRLSTTIRVPVRSASTNATVSCAVTLSVLADYFKPSKSFTITETSDGTATSNCASTQVPLLQVFATLDHRCLGNEHSKDGSDSGSGFGPVHTALLQYVQTQEVGLFPPSFAWCYYGTTILWHWRGYLQTNLGNVSQVCIDASALIPGKITGSGVPCP